MGVEQRQKYPAKSGLGSGMSVWDCLDSREVVFHLGAGGVSLGPQDVHRLVGQLTGILEAWGERENPLPWFQEFDDDDNPFWSAAGPYNDGFTWHIHKTLIGGEIVYQCHSDLELVGDSRGDYWPTLREAQAALEQAHQNALADSAE
jgi:hypothetical protein